MTNLAIILGGLLVALFIVVSFTERQGKTMNEEQMQKMSGILIVLVAVMVFLVVLKYVIGF